MSAERYVPTFDSDKPWIGIIVDEDRDRYARFTSVQGAEDQAALLNADHVLLTGDSLEDVLIWRDCSSGLVLESNGSGS